MEEKKPKWQPGPGRGGKRPGAGRPAKHLGTGIARSHTVWCTDLEYRLIRAIIKDVRDNPEKYGIVPNKEI